MKTLTHILSSLTVALLLLLTPSAHAQGIITTIAGSNDTAIGDGGPATSAGLYGPFDVALDGKGNY